MIILGLMAALAAAVPTASSGTNVGSNAATNAPTAYMTNFDAVVEQEFKQLEHDDDDAIAEVDNWIKEYQTSTNAGEATFDSLQRRIRARLEPIRQRYDDFVKRYPGHVKAHLAYGGLLEDLKDDDGSRAEIEKALAIDTNNAAAWNNLAGHYSHIGPPSKMFDCYLRAIAIDPHESVYYQNLGDAVFVYRSNAMEYFHLADEQAVYNKSLDLYREGLKTDPTNFTLASELAQSYYAIKPTRVEDALRAWTNALNLAPNELARQGVYVHLSRFKLSDGRFTEAHQDIDRVNLEPLADLKARILHNLDAREHEQSTNHPPAATDPHKPDRK